MRLQKDVIEFIKNENENYSNLAKHAYEKFGVKLGKSLISYYKRHKPRLKLIDFSKIPEWKSEWLFGLYYADGCKFIDKGAYTIKFYLDNKRDQDIVKRTFRILRMLGLSPYLFVERGKLVIRVYSKELYKFLPVKSESYKPKDTLAFLSGLIDGDGSARRNHAYISQTYHEDLMNDLTEKLNLSKNIHYRTGWGGKGERKEIIYYVPDRIGKVLIEKNYCIKLLRQFN